MRYFTILLCVALLSGCVSVTFSKAPEGTEPCMTGAVVGGAAGAVAGGAAGYHLIGKGRGRILGAIIGAAAGGAGGAVAGDAICRANQ